MAEAEQLRINEEEDHVREEDHMRNEEDEPLLVRDGANHKRRNYLIAMVIAVLLVLVLSAGIAVLSTSQLTVNNNNSIDNNSSSVNNDSLSGDHIPAETLHNKCHKNTTSCLFLRWFKDSNFLCKTDSLPLNVQGYNTTSVQCTIKTDLFCRAHAKATLCDSDVGDKHCQCHVLSTSDTSGISTLCSGGCNLEITRCPVT